MSGSNIISRQWPHGMKTIPVSTREQLSGVRQKVAQLVSLISPGKSLSACGRNPIEKVTAWEDLLSFHFGIRNRERNKVFAENVNQELPRSAIH